MQEAEQRMNGAVDMLMATPQQQQQVEQLAGQLEQSGAPMEAQIPMM